MDRRLDRPSKGTSRGVIRGPDLLFIGMSSFAEPASCCVFFLLGDSLARLCPASSVDGLATSPSGAVPNFLVGSNVLSDVYVHMLNQEKIIFASEPYSSAELLLILNTRRIEMRLTCSLVANRASRRKFLPHRELGNGRRTHGVR